MIRRLAFFILLGTLCKYLYVRMMTAVKYHAEKTEKNCLGCRTFKIKLQNNTQAYYGTFLLILSGLFNTNIVFLLPLAHTEDIPGKIHLIIAECGKNVDLTCPVLEEKPEFHFWYKQRFGHMIQTVATGTDDQLLLKGPFKNSRFNVTKVGALHCLTIKNVSKEDEGTYFCQTGAVYTQKFTNATVLVVNGMYECLNVFLCNASVNTQTIYLTSAIL